MIENMGIVAGFACAPDWHSSLIDKGQPLYEWVGPSSRMEQVKSPKDVIPPQAQVSIDGCSGCRVLSYLQQVPLGKGLFTNEALNRGEQVAFETFISSCRFVRGLSYEDACNWIMKANSVVYSTPDEIISPP